MWQCGSNKECSARSNVSNSQGCPPKISLQVCRLSWTGEMLQFKCPRCSSRTEIFACSLFCWMILKYLTSGSRQAASSLGAPRVAARRRRRRRREREPGLAGPGRAWRCENTELVRLGQLQPLARTSWLCCAALSHLELINLNISNTHSLTQPHNTQPYRLSNHPPTGG